MESKWFARHPFMKVLFLIAVAVVLITYTLPICANSHSCSRRQWRLLCPVRKPCISTVYSGGRWCVGTHMLPACNNSMAIAQQDNARVTVFETPYTYNMLTGEQFPLLADGSLHTGTPQGLRSPSSSKLPQNGAMGRPVTAEDVAYTWATHVKYETEVGVSYQDLHRQHHGSRCSDGFSDAQNWIWAGKLSIRC